MNPIRSLSSAGRSPGAITLHQMRERSMASSIFIFFIMALAFATNLPNIAWGQAPECNIATPTDSSINCPIRPTITVKTHDRIDTSDIFWKRNIPDSLERPFLDATVALIPKSLKYALADSVQPWAYINGTCALINDTTITFTPTVDLQYYTEYEAWVKNLRVIRTSGTNYDTINVSPDSVLFRTIPAIHRLLRTSIDESGYIHCGDTLKVTFNRPMTLSPTPQGPVIHIFRIDSVASQFGDATFSRTEIPCTTWIQLNDSTTIRILPNVPLQAGRLHTLDIHTSYLTGDSIDDRRITFSIKDNFKVKLATRASDTADTLTPSIYTFPTVGDRYYNVGERIVAGAVDGDTNFVFDHWECPQIPDLNNRWIPVIELQQPCSSAVDIDLTAVYARKRSVQMTIEAAGCFHVNVHNSKGAFLGNAGNYTVAPDDYLIIDPVPFDTTCRFKRWISSDLIYNGASTPIMRIANRGRAVNIKVDFEPNTPTITGVCVYAYVDDGRSLIRESGGYQGGDDPSGILDVTPSACSFVINNLPISVSANIHPGSEGCFCIDSVIIKPPTGPMQRIALNCATTVPAIPIPPTSPATAVWFIAKRKVSTPYQLTIETEITNARAIPDYGTTESLKKIGPRRDVTVGVFRINRIGTSQFMGYTDEDINGATLTKQFECGTRVRLEALSNLRERGYKLVQWYDAQTPSNSNGNLSGATYNTYPVPNSEPYFDFLMNMSRTARAKFSQVFHLRNILIYDNDTSTPRKVSIGQFAGQTIQNINVFGMTSSQKIGLLGSGTRFGTRIGLEFDDEVNQPTLSGRFSCFERSDRIDLHRKQSYSGQSNSQTWPDNRTVQLNLYPTFATSSGPLGIPMGEDFAIQVLQGIKSASGESIDITSIGTFLCRTKLPGTKITLKTLRMLAPMDANIDGPSEVRTTLTAMHSSRTKLNSKAEMNFPADTCYSEMGVGETRHYPFSPILTIGHPGYSDYISAAAFSLDIDRNERICEKNSTYAIERDRGMSTTCWLALLFAFGALIGILFNPANILAWIIAISSLVVAYEQFNLPDVIGSPSWSFDWPNDWFGLRPGSDHELTQENTNALWELGIEFLDN